MPSYRFFMDTPLIEGQSVCFSEEEYKHIVKVMRLEVQDTLEIVNGKGCLAKGLITDISKHTVFCNILSVEHDHHHHPKFIIAQSFLKGSSLELICEKNTELGVMELWLFPADFSEKHELSQNQLERLRKHMVSALKQSGRLFLPTIQVFSSLPCLLAQSNYTFFFGDLSEKAIPLAQHPSALTPVFIIGPEKGFSDQETTLLKQKAQGVTLGPYILRAETASIAASALLGSFLNV